MHILACWSDFRTLVFAILVCSIAVEGRSASVESVKVIASVVDIAKREAPLSPGIGIEFVIHTPEKLRATKFILVTRVAERSQARATYPIGILVSIELPASTVDVLMRQRADLDSCERQIDTGVRPEMISQGILLPSVEANQLRTAPERYQSSE